MNLQEFALKIQFNEEGMVLRPMIAVQFALGAVGSGDMMVVGKYNKQSTSCL